ncbi:Hypothetical predicted protein [Octopus vulgaris]|uniref:Transmembrane protein 246 n=1 Tax=Octopus vulgaris TaxID=6645 RepID=A0AA36F0A5_OCTVU|nr:Hypothetical predicted protein [Octopus vulgaris]
MRRKFYILVKYIAETCVKWLPKPGQQARTHLVILYSVTFFLILPTLCHKLPFSVYYHAGHADKDDGIRKFNDENDERLKLSRNFLKNAFSSMKRLPNSPLVTSKLNFPEDALTLFGQPRLKVDIALTIITVSRNRHKFNNYEPHYLTQAVWRYMELLLSSENRQRNVKLSLCNVDRDPDTYHETRNLSSFIQTFQRFPTKSSYSFEVFEKEKEDYVYCLNASLVWKPSFVLLVEDDSLPTNDMFRVLYHVLDYIYHVKNQHGSYQHFPEQWYLKLYHPDRLLGYWSIEVERIPELISLSLVFGVLVLLIYRCIGMKNVFRNINASWFLLSLYFFLLFIAIGRQNLLEFRRLSKHFYMLTPSPSCCTPAILYTNATAKTVIDYLSHVRCKSRFAKDMALEQLRSETHLKAYLLQPNLFKHIGLYSSLRSKILSPGVV